MTKKERNRIEKCIAKKFKDGVDYTLLNKGERKVAISLCMDCVANADYMLSLPLTDSEARFYSEESKSCYDAINEIKKLNK